MILKILFASIFFYSLNSWGLVIKEERTPLAFRIAIFRSEFFCNTVYVFSVIFAIASGIILSILSWKLGLITLILSGLLFPIIGKTIALKIWAPIYFILEKRTIKKQNKMEDE
jgi:hypothetical protein